MPGFECYKREPEGLQPWHVFALPEPSACEGELNLAGLFAETPGSYRPARVLLAKLEVVLLRSKAWREERKTGRRKFPEGDRKP